MKTINLAGNYDVTIDHDTHYNATLPGTLDENAIGYPDTNKHAWHPDEQNADNQSKNTGLHVNNLITSRFTRKYSYEGIANYTKMLSYADIVNSLDSTSMDTKSNITESNTIHSTSRIFLEIERSRKLSSYWNGQILTPYQEGSLSTPYIYEVTNLLKDQNEITFTCDNAYHSWPAEAITYSSAATDETQTNWNGLLGFLRLRMEQANFISAIRIYPHIGQLLVQVEIDATHTYTESITITSSLFKTSKEVTLQLEQGIHTYSFTYDIPASAKKWDEYQGNVYTLTISGVTLEEKEATFGIRDFCQDHGPYLTLNGHRIFLRSEANCCVFPESGHMPMDVASWKQILETYKGYGVNCLRFHSHCPPEAAFIAADAMGILMQPELSHWDPKHAFESDESYAYYQLELKQILLTYANHPSFVMLSFGNELHCNETGIERMRLMLQMAKSIDTTRLYSSASNGFYGNRGPDKASDFYTSSNYYEDMLRATSAGMIGHINQQYPTATTNYDKAMATLHANYPKPVFTFETGQYEVLPDFDELEDFHGVTIPDNINIIKEHITEAGFLPDWKRRVEATGELSLLAYREEVEATLRTNELSGISLLGLQDFPGQGTALVGILNSHLQPKPYSFASPERFSQFFCNALPLVLLEKYTYTNQETLTATVQFANYSTENITGVLQYKLYQNDQIIKENTLSTVTCPAQGLTTLEEISISLDDIKVPARLTLEVAVASHKNEYPIWVYPDNLPTITEGIYPVELSSHVKDNPICNTLLSPDNHKKDTDNILITTNWNTTLEALHKGQSVFYSPQATDENFPHAINACFTTDFWSVGTFGFQEGYMGCMVEPTHPVFASFPTEFHSNYQWWSLTHSKAMIIPNKVTPLVEALDCYARLRKMAFLFECKVGTGKLIVSSMGLLEKQEYPEVRSMLHSILNYMQSSSFTPSQELSLDDLDKIFTF